jgi:hypothetical protein
LINTDRRQTNKIIRKERPDNAKSEAEETNVRADPIPVVPRKTIEPAALSAGNSARHGAVDRRRAGASDPVSDWRESRCK